MMHKMFSFLFQMLVTRAFLTESTKKILSVVTFVCYYLLDSEKIQKNFEKIN